MDGFLLVNKPKGYTSHDLVMKTRRILNTKKIGHGGTLDPNATGLMLLTLGKATKMTQFVQLHDKEYIAQIKLGIYTDSLDITGNVIETAEVNPVSVEQINDVFKSMIGPQKQLPPMYSAKKVNGQTLYKAARNNQEVERKPADITIYELQLLRYENDLIDFRVKCSTGTYIRVLADDICRKLNNIGTLNELCRTEIADFTLDQAYTLEQIEEGNFTLLTTYDVMNFYPYYEMEDITDVLNGKTIRLNTKEETVIITHENEVIAVYEKLPNNYYHCKRGLW